MKDGICPKCGSGEIYIKPNLITAYLFDAFLMDVSFLVCTDCRHVEMYVRDEAVIQDIRQKWQRYMPRKKKRKNNEMIKRKNDAQDDPL